MKKLRARRLLRMHLGASVLLGLAALVAVFGIAGTIWYLNTIVVDHVLKIQGVLQAIEQSTPVTHDTGGIVRNVYVTEGEVVSEGQLLMSLDASDIESEFIEAQRQVATLMLRSQCLKSLLAKTNSIQIPPELRVALGRLNQLEEMHRSVRDCKGELLQQELLRLQQKENLANLQSQIANYTRLAHVGQQMRGRFRELAAEGLSEGLQEIANLKTMSDSLKNLITLTDLRKKFFSTRVEIQGAEIRKRKALNQQLDSIIDALATAENRLARLERIQQNRFIYANASGRVQRLRITKNGKRVARGAYLLEIAPLTTDFEVLATIRVAELSYIRIGQTVEVTLSSGLPGAAAVPATVTDIVKASANTRTVKIAIERSELNRRDLLVGERSLNGLGERSEALVEVKTSTGFQALRSILLSDYTLAL